MKSWLGAWLIVSTVGAPAYSQVTYGFSTSDYMIEMKVRFLVPFAGGRLVFLTSARSPEGICYTGEIKTADECPDEFVGAAAIVSYFVTLPDGKPADRSAIRESVTLTAQSSGLGPRAPFSKTQPLVKGTASDLQAFGYDQGIVRKADRSWTRAHMARQWRIYRQELYMDRDEKPFAIIEWKHTLDRISIVRIYAPPPASEARH